MLAYVNWKSKGLSLDWRASCAGKELYLIPGIDMLNHSTRPEDVNTTLQRRTETVSKHSSNHGDSVDFSGFFAIEAGKLVTSFCVLPQDPRSWEHPRAAWLLLAALQLHLPIEDLSDACCILVAVSLQKNSC